MSRIGYYLVPSSVGDTPCYAIRVVPNDVYNLNDIARFVVNALIMPENRVLSIIEQAFASAIEMCKEGRAVDFGMFSLKPRIPGSAECVDSPFDPEDQRVIIDGYFTGDAAEIFRETEVYRVDQGEMTERVKVSNVVDVATQTFGLIDGTGTFRITGNGITLDATGEYVKLIDKKTEAVVATAVVDTVSKGQRAICHFEYVDTPTGDYALEVATHGLVGDEALHVFRKAVHFIKGTPPPPPTPTITKVVSDRGDDIIYPTASITINGTLLNMAAYADVEIKDTAGEDKHIVVSGGTAGEGGTTFECWLEDLDEGVTPDYDEPAKVVLYNSNAQKLVEKEVTLQAKA